MTLYTPWCGVRSEDIRTLLPLTGSLYASGQEVLRCMVIFDKGFACISSVLLVVSSCDLLRYRSMRIFVKKIA